MHHLRLKAAIEKYNSIPLAELEASLKADEKAAYSEEEIEEIKSVIATERLNAKGFKPKGPNDNLDLSKFDYENLTGDSWKEYREMFDKLPGHENRDFVQYMASGVFKTILNDNADKEIVLVGIKINQSKPVNTTRIPVNMARNLNAQIMDRNNPASNSRYFLLKKPA